MHVEQSRRGFLRRLVPKPHPTTDKPHVILENNRRVWFEPSLESGTEHLCWCFPSGKSGTFGDYFALPTEFLDPLHGVCLLNVCMQIREGRPGYDDATKAMSKILDGLADIRPNKILCAEGELASNYVKKFLKSQGFRKGRPQVALDSIESFEKPPH